jgi:hypothetical protein
LRSASYRGAPPSAREEDAPRLAAAIANAALIPNRTTRLVFMFISVPSLASLNQQTGIRNQGSGIQNAAF